MNRSLFWNPSLVLISLEASIYNIRGNCLPESAFGFSVGPLKKSPQLDEDEVSEIVGNILVGIGNFSIFVTQASLGFVEDSNSNLV